MTEAKKIIVNALEPPTWRWLSLNGEEIEVPLEFAEEPSHIVRIDEGRRKVLVKISGEGEWKKKKIEIRAGKHSEGSVIVLIEVKGGERLFLKTSLFLEEGSSLEVKKVILNDGLCVEESEAKAASFSSLKADYCAIGGETYSNLSALMEGKGATFTSFFSYLCKEKEILDINFTARHKGEKSESLMKAGGSLFGLSSKTYRGTIDFLKGAKGAKGSESEEVLVFSNDAVNKSAPLILCGEEDVAGDHASTIGKIGSDTIFYMMSRGLPREKAEKLLALSFVSSFSAELWSEEVKNKIYEKCRNSGFPFDKREDV